MIKSMTAFARVSRRTELGELSWELRTVNHRYLEIHPRLPEELRGLETAVRERLAARLQRGKLDGLLRHVPSHGVAGALHLNRPFVEQLLAAGRELGALIGRDAAPTPFELLRWPGVLDEDPQDPERLGAAALELLETAIDSLLATREREGARLAQVLRDRRARLAECVARVRARMPEVLAGVRRRLVERLAELRGELDPNRLEQELVLFAARLDVDEELDRLEAHLAEIGEVLGRREPVGRRLDFLMQELNREANTLGSKAADVEITRAAVDMKVLIEQMREQIQNLE